MNMLSQAHNCIFYNCLFNSGVHHTGHDLMLLQQLRQSMSEDMVKEYYAKSQSIIETLNSKQLNNKALWSEVDKTVVRILDNLDNTDNSRAVQMTRDMLDDLEKKYC